MGEAIRTPRSGHQYEVSAHGYVARIAGVGATLRVLRHDSRDLITPFDADELRPAMRGAVMAPWPNRTADGRYTFGGDIHQLVCNEVETANAAHGLVAWLEFSCLERAADRVVLTATLAPQPGYPWHVQIDVVFELDAEGLVQHVIATNKSSDAAPFGVGGHPYLVAGAPSMSAVDDWMLELPADEVLLVSADRLLPTGIAPVDTHDQGRLDFRTPRAIGGDDHESRVHVAPTRSRRTYAGDVSGRVASSARRSL